MINNNLKSIRKDRGMSITELAKRAKLSRLTISNVENGYSNPTIKTAAAICKVLEKEPKDIFFNFNVNHEIQKRGIEKW